MHTTDQRVWCEVNGVPMRLDLGEAIQHAMANGVYEPEETQWVKTFFGPGRLFLDIGASFGYYTTLAWSLGGPNGRVIAFEPSPVAHLALSETIAQAGLHTVTLVNAAVGKEAGETTLYLPNTDDLHSPSRFESHPGHIPIKVPIVVLDAFSPLQQFDHIDFVKIDVEGSEPDVIDGMRSLIDSGRVHRILCEFNSWWLHANASSHEALLEKFMDFGFEIESQTILLRDLPAVPGETFNLQSILFRYRGV
ncbi:MAG: FkbM family methyltransferase [Alphaproteobacteria bacterium]|nr:FkbM family methyltransferase [Alphaproteobacteria bacterium]